MSTDRITDRYPAVPFAPPATEHFVYLGWSVAPPARLPRVGRSARRAEILGRVATLASEYERRDDVTRVDVFETRLMPPIPGLPRWDVLLLGRARTPEAATALTEAARAIEGAGPVHVMPARNVRQIGDVDAPGTGTYLFNHFTGPDVATALPAWEEAAAWFLAETGVDNSLLLEPDDTTEFVLVNHAQLPTGPIAFLRRQLVRPSFHRLVRRMLREHGLAALPLLARRV